jgi:hypothetical protein
MQHPDFYYLWYDIFRLEIEEENLGGVFSGWRINAWTTKSFRRCFK